MNTLPRHYSEADAYTTSPSPFTLPLQNLMASNISEEKNYSWVDNPTTVYSNVNIAETAVQSEFYNHGGSIMKDSNLGMAEEELMDMQATYSYSPNPVPYPFVNSSN